METLDQVRIRLSAELAEAEKKQAIADQLPVEPHRLSSVYSGHYWATYPVKTTGQIADLIRRFAPMIINLVQIRHGSLYMVPLEILPANVRNMADAGEEKTFCLTTHQGPGFGITVLFFFYVRTPSGHIVRIGCELPNNYRASARLRAAEYRHGRLVREAGSDPCPALHGLFHDFIRWSPNNPGQDARYTYTLTDDGPDYRETLSILENTELADWWRVAE